MRSKSGRPTQRLAAALVTASVSAAAFAGFPSLAHAATQSVSPVAPSPSSGPVTQDQPSGASSLTPPPNNGAPKGFDAAKSVQDQDASTATQKVFRNPDGSHTTVSSPEPSEFKDASGWHAIDLTPVLGQDGSVHAKAGGPQAGNVVLPAAAGSALSVPTAAGTVSVTHADAAGSSVPPVLPAAPTGSTPQASPLAGPPASSTPVKYPGALAGGRDLSVALTPAGFEETVTLPMGAPASYTDVLTLPAGVVAKDNGAGVVELLDGTGQLVATFGAGMAHDSSKPTASGESPEIQVSTSLVGQSGQQATISVSVPASWLSDPARVFPVTVDPSFHTGAAGGDTYVDSEYTSSHWSEGELRIGTWDDNEYTRSLINFDTSSMPANATVSSATMSLNNFYSYSCNARQVDINPLDGGFNSSTVWSNQPGIYGGYQSSLSFAHGYSSSCGGAWETWNIQPIAQAWANGMPRYGVMVSADNESDVYGWKKFYSQESAYGAGAAPAIDVTWDTPQGTTTVAQMSPSNGSVLSDLTPKLSATGVPTSNNGNPVQWGIHVSTNPDPDASAGQVYATPWQSPNANPSVNVPGGDLRDGMTYYWRVVTSDGTFYEQGPVSSFRIDSRLGAEKPSPMDSIGGLQVNLATGNLFTTITTPSVTTTAGPVGLRLTYNSQQTNASAGAVTDAVSQGWTDAAGSTLQTGYAHALISSAAVDMVDATGAKHHYTTNNGGTSYAPTQAGDDAQLTLINGALKVVNNDGTVYTFNAADSTGKATVASIVSGTDDTHPAGLVYSYQTIPGATGPRLNAVWDPVTGKQAMTLTYTGQTSPSSCPGTPPSGFAAWSSVKAGLLCAAKTWDGATTTLYYDSSSQLRRALLPGNSDTTQTDRPPFYDFAYTNGLLTSLRNPLANDDLGHLGQQDTSDLAYSTVITYSAAPSSSDPGAPLQVTKIQAPSATGTAQDPNRMQHTYLDSAPQAGAAGTAAVYTAGETTNAPGGGTVGSTTFTNGWTRKVDFDASDRQYRDWDPFLAAAGTNSTPYTVYNWDSMDHLNWGQTPDGLRTGYVYDHSAVTNPDSPWNLTDTFGPIPAKCYQTNNVIPQSGSGVPSGCPTLAPQDYKDFDTGMNGLAATFYPDRTLTALAPNPSAGNFSTGVVHQLGVQPPGNYGFLYADWAAASNPTPKPTGLNTSNGFSASFAGTLNVPSSGSYSFQMFLQGGARIVIDDTVVQDLFSGTDTNGWTTLVPVSLTSGAHRIRVDFHSASNNSARVELWWQPPGASSAAVVPDTDLAPRYNLLVKHYVVDSTTPITATTATRNDPVTQTSYSGGGLTPADGVATSISTDPNGLNLTTSTTYETPGTAGSFIRPLTTATPAGTANSVAYYGTSDTAANPCVSGSPAVPQAGLPKTTTDPKPSGGNQGASTTMVYDATGRLAASTLTGPDGVQEAPTCTTHDARGRTTAVTTPQPDVAGTGSSTPATTTTTTYAVSGDPLVSSTSQHTGGSNGQVTSTITSRVDLLGRTVSYTDALGVVTTTSYDQAGRAAASTTTSPTRRDTGATTSYTRGATYQPDGKQATTTLAVGGAAATTLATVTYNQTTGRVQSIAYSNGTSLQGTYGMTGSVDGLTYTFPSVAGGGSGATETDTVTRSIAGHILADTVSDPTTPSSQALQPSTYSYDAAGRLATAAAGPTGARHNYSYAYNTSNYCPSGSTTTAGKNSNRTQMVDTVGSTSTTTDYCYDAADRLTATYVNGTPNLQPSYDSHGNTLSLTAPGVSAQPSTLAGTESFDGNDLNSGVAVGGGTATYTRDAQGRVTQRAVTGEPLQQYGYEGGSDSPALIMGYNYDVREIMTGLPGGVTATTTGNGSVWSYPDIHGDVITTADGSGAKTVGSATYDPFGTSLTPASSSYPNGQPSDMDAQASASYGAFGAAHRMTEEGAGLLDQVEMGQRLYMPQLGRFLQIDPKPGGSANNYDYCNQDPVGSSDSAGTRPIFDESTQAANEADMNAWEEQQHANSGWTPPPAHPTVVSATRQAPSPAPTPSPVRAITPARHSAWLHAIASGGKNLWAAVKHYGGSCLRGAANAFALSAIAAPETGGASLIAGSLAGCGVAMVGQRVTEVAGEAVGRDYEGASALNDAIDFADQMLNSLNGTVVP